MHRFVLDAGVAHGIAGILRMRGLDIDSAKELDRLGLSDVQALLRAAVDGRAIITHNSRDFLALHEAWLTWARRWSDEASAGSGRPITLSPHAGILIVPHAPRYHLAQIIAEFSEGVETLENRLFVWRPTNEWNEVRVP